MSKRDSTCWSQGQVQPQPRWFLRASLGLQSRGHRLVINPPKKLLTGVTEESSHHRRCLWKLSFAPGHIRGVKSSTVGVGGHGPPSAEPEFLFSCRLCSPELSKGCTSVFITCCSRAPASCLLPPFPALLFTLSASALRCC